MGYSYLTGECVGGPKDGELLAHYAPEFRLATYMPLVAAAEPLPLDRDPQVWHHRYTWDGERWQYEGCFA